MAAMISPSCLRTTRGCLGPERGLILFAATLMIAYQLGSLSAG